MRAIHDVARMAGSYDCKLNHAYELAALRTFLFELDLTAFLGEQGVVTTDADVHARVESRSALANNDVAGNDFLAAVDFNAKAFTF